MKASGTRTERTVRENFGMWTAIPVMIPQILEDEGEWKGDKADGYGVYFHMNGAKYEGYWKDDL